VQYFSLILRELIIYTDPHFEGNGDDLRLAITGHWKNRKAFHGHHEDGKPIYWLPPVRYLGGIQPRIVAIKSGISDLDNIYQGLEEVLRLGKEEFRITATEMSDKTVAFGLSESLYTYISISPWVALNQKRFEEYICSGNKSKRKNLLENIFIGNLLSLSKGLGYHVESRILAKLHSFIDEPIKFKEVPLTTFKIKITTNFILPEAIGIGRHTSLGYGRFNELKA